MLSKKLLHSYFCSLVFTGFIYNVYFITDQEASSSSSSSVETPCINIFNIKNTQEENTENIENIREEDTPLDMITFNERDINKTKISDSGTQQTSLSLSSTSPRKVHLYQQIRGYKRKIANLEKELQKAKKMKKEDIHTLDMLLEQYFPKQTSEFLKMQARLFQKNAKGRRYNDASFKQHCLSIYFLSPKVYKDLAIKSKLFCLPSCATLKRFTQNCYICPGLEENVFKILKIKTDNLPDINKYCICYIDEMSLKSHLFYNITGDKVIGFEDIGCPQNNSQLPACNVAVIMVKGICQSWKQPLCYFFLHSTIKASDLLKIIPEAVRKIKSIGLKLVGFTSDMGSNFYQLTRLLNINDETPYFKIDEEKIFYFFDVPHLIKAIRNLLLQYYVHDGDKIVSWKHIEKFYAIDKKAQFRAAPRLTDSHIYPNNFEKMKVKYAVQVLSHTVSAGINTFVSLKSLPTETIQQIS